MPIKIAIVDDHTMMVHAIANMLNQKQEFTVCMTARNGKNFIEQLSTIPEEPEMVLLDINMPLMNGWETADWILSHKPQMKILCLTMNDDDVSIIKMFKHGAKGYVLKDAEEEELFKAIQSVMDKGFYYSDYVAQVMINSFKDEQVQDEPIHHKQLKDREM